METVAYLSVIVLMTTSGFEEPHENAKKLLRECTPST
jgi:hypothetical protein